MAGIQMRLIDFLRPVADEGYIRAPDFAKRRPDGGVVLVKIEGAHTPRDALFRAGKVFVQYRKSRGACSGVLPDFFIGAHAAVSGLALPHARWRALSALFPGDGADRAGKAGVRHR